ncbi:hypothetical protein A0J48_010200 [Sphaerospermopsis aphanizomenoides BCCUSP55]|uniref:hypothetical protein n=1 Tax=Sphaerospermopsis aphanizomenoides TaxID=459663 RepID=UPI001906B2D6|nr:hypothetical protein [Sphaerospermopsis aphanizomenoides]MBK1987906.1 hypothetical protein [Sphaerospermopsis aphanizomenoides BCCUSP55]
MVKYSFSLKIKGTSDEYTYALNLNYRQENFPEEIFTQEIRENLRTTLQNKSLCAIKDHHLNQIIQTWIQDIREGYRDSNLTLNLPLLIESSIEQLNEPGNQDLPTIISPNLSEIEPKIGKFPPLNFV